jgi:hypothetical protein
MIGTIRNRSRLVALGALLGPVAALWGMKLVVGGGPAEAPAAIASVSAEPQASALPPARGESQLRAEEYLAGWVMPPGVRSPMNHPPAPVEPVPEAVMPPPALVASKEPAPAFAVNTIFATPAGGMATINGKVRRVGDALANGWKVESVDVKGRVVHLSGPGGATMELSAKR